MLRLFMDHLPQCAQVIGVEPVAMQNILQEWAPLAEWADARLIALIASHYRANVIVFNQADACLEAITHNAEHLSTSPWWILRCTGEADGGGNFKNEKLRDLCWERNIILSFSPAHQPSSNGIAERMVGILKSTVRRMLKQAHLDRDMMREKVLGREWTYHPFFFGQLVGVRKSHDKAQANSLDDRGSVGYLLDIDIWQSGATCST